LEKLFSPLKSAFFCNFFAPEDNIETFSQQAYSWRAMKMARSLSISMLGLILGMTGAGADPSFSDSSGNPYVQTDPDGVPLSVTRPQRGPSPSEAEAYRKIQERAAHDKDWLLRGYEQQLQARDKANAAKDQSANLYYQLSSNKELAKLAGLPDLDLNSPDNTTAYRTGVAPSGSSAALRPDTSSSTAIGHSSFFKPLITPLSAPGAAGMQNLYSSLPVSMAPPFSGAVSPTATAPKADQYQESLDIQPPGMVAAKKDPLSSSDLSLDILPGESIEQARAHQNSSKLELSLPMDANQMHRAQAVTMSPPNAVKAAAPAPATVNAVPVVPTEDPNAPLPTSKAPPINPVRAPISNPYDILDR
jgi:hypothetical protein